MNLVIMNFSYNFKYANFSYNKFPEISSMVFSDPALCADFRVLYFFENTYSLWQTIFHQ